MKLYVGNLSYEVTDTTLRELFAPYGEIESAIIITERDSGRSKGFGFVEFSDSNQAKAAMAALNGKEHNGRSLTVNEAKPRNDSGGNRGGGRRDRY